MQNLLERSQVLHARYSQTWLLEDVEERIRVLRHVLAILPGEGPDYSTNDAAGLSQYSSDKDYGVMITATYQLAVALGDHYKHLGGLEDLDAQVKLLQLASATLSDDSSLVISIRSELGAALRTRFIHSGDSADILEAYNIHSSLLDRHPEGNPHHPRLLYELAHTHFARTDARTAHDDDLPRSIEMLKISLKLLKESDPCRPMCQYVLANASWRTVERREDDISLLRAASEIYRDLIRSQPSNHPHHWLFHQSFGGCLGVLYVRTNDIVFLSEALDHFRCAFGMLDSRSPNRVRPAQNLALALFFRFRYLGTAEDLHESIEILQSCLDIAHSSHFNIIHTLAMALDHRYDTFGVPEDLDESIALLRGVHYTDPHVFPGQAKRAYILAGELLRRCRRDKRVSDITEAIALCREILQDERTPFAINAVCGLAECLSQYHKECGDMGKLQEAITLCETWLGKSQSEHHGLLLCTYASSLLLRYECSHNSEDLGKAILSYEGALEHLPAGHTDRPTRIISLSESVRRRFEISNLSEDIQRAANLLKEAQSYLPDGQPDRATTLFKLARLHLYETAPFFDIRASLEQTTQAVTYGYQDAQRRLSQVLDVLRHLERHGSLLQRDPSLREACLKVYTLSIELLPRVAYFGLDIASRLRVLNDSDHLAADGAAHALILSQPKLAIELLEQGRAVFWSQHLRLRTAFNALPLELAEKLTRTAAALERGSYVAEMAGQMQTTDDDQAKAARETKTANQRRLGDEFEELIRHTRGLLGFERFMLPETFQALGSAASHGPVVVLIANDVTCQAIVIENPETVLQVHLPDASLQDLQVLCGIMRVSIHRGRDILRDRAMKRISEKGGKKTEDVLADLWYKVLQRIVNSMQMKVCSPCSYDAFIFNPECNFQKAEGRERPRVTICPTGVFINLPLHAAGVYGGGQSEEMECLSDYWVTSHTPTIGALLNARRQSLAVPATAARLLLAAVSTPSKWGRLPFAAREVETVKSIIPSYVPLDYLSDVDGLGIGPATAPTAGAILERLPEAAIVHLACHGHQDIRNPLESGFVMQDGMLTVAKLMSLNLDKAFLAFLSACETAKGDQSQPNQAIHLAATMLFAGFKSVVGTMW